MAEEWPITAGPGAHLDNDARVRGRDRLRTVRADFFLDAAERLTEQERALMTAMLHGLVSDVVDELRAELPVTAAANDPSNAPTIGALQNAGLLDRPALVRLLLRRTDEERIASAARARCGHRDGRMLQALVSHHEGPIAAAAMSLIVARGRRRDRFGQVLLGLDDLSPAEAVALVQAVAAVLRGEFLPSGRAGVADKTLSEATAAMLRRHDSAASLDALSIALADLLEAGQELGDDLLVAAAVEGEIMLLAAMIGRRAQVPAPTVFDEIMSGETARIVMLLRMARVARAAAAGLLASVGDLLGITDLATAIALFENLGEDEVEDARAWLAADAQYRAAVFHLGAN